MGPMSPRCRSCSPVPPELRAAASLLERRWTLATIYACATGATRFNEFRQSLPGVSPTTLSERLEQLEAAGILERRLVPGRPPHTEYTLTRRGGRLAEVVAELLDDRVGGSARSARTS
jgi:DNA-binding HxlR family transcriptional regulator